jgi:hypothetical protein
LPVVAQAAAVFVVVVAVQVDIEPLRERVEVVHQLNLPFQLTSLLITPLRLVLVEQVLQMPLEPTVLTQFFPRLHQLVEVQAVVIGIVVQMELRVVLVVEPSEQVVPQMQVVPEPQTKVMLGAKDSVAVHNAVVVVVERVLLETPVAEVEQTGMEGPVLHLQSRARA